MRTSDDTDGGSLPLLMQPTYVAKSVTTEATFASAIADTWRARVCSPYNCIKLMSDDQVVLGIPICRIGHGNVATVRTGKLYRFKPRRVMF